MMKTYYLETEFQEAAITMLCSDDEEAKFAVEREYTQEDGPMTLYKKDAVGRRRVIAYWP